jgi:hypothetical protein
MNEASSVRESVSWETLVDGLFEAGWLSSSSDLASQISDLTVFWQSALGKPNEVIESCIKLFDCEERQFVSRINPKSSRVPSSGG